MCKRLGVLACPEPKIRWALDNQKNWKADYHPSKGTSKRTLGIRLIKLLLKVVLHVALQEFATFGGFHLIQVSRY